MGLWGVGGVFWIFFCDCYCALAPYSEYYSKHTPWHPVVELARLFHHRPTLQSTLHITHCRSSEPPVQIFRCAQMTPLLRDPYGSVYRSSHSSVDGLSHASPSSAAYTRTENELLYRCGRCLLLHCFPATFADWPPPGRPTLPTSCDSGSGFEQSHLCSLFGKACTNNTRVMHHIRSGCMNQVSIARFETLMLRKVPLTSGV